MRKSSFNDYVPQKKLVEMLAINTYGFNKKYKKHLPEPIRLTNNRIPIYKLQDISDFHESVGQDFTAYEKALRYYRSEMSQLDTGFDDYVTVNQALDIVPFKKQSLSQGSQIGIISKINVWNVDFYHRASLKEWVMDNERLDRIREGWEQGTSPVHAKYKTYGQWLKAMRKW